MYTKRSPIATTTVILSIAAGMFLPGCGLAQGLEPTITPTPSNCPTVAMAAEVRTSSTNIKVGDTFTVTGVVNWPIGPVYFLGIEDVGIDPNANDNNNVIDYNFPQGLTIRINSRIISKIIEVPDSDTLDPVKGISVVLRAEQPGILKVIFQVNGESGNDCAGFPIWNYSDLHSDPLTITVTASGIEPVPLSSTVTPAIEMVYMGGCSAAELKSPEVTVYITAVNEEFTNIDQYKIEVDLASVQSAYDNLPACVQNYIEPYNTPLALAFTAAAQARDEVDPARMQNYMDIQSGYLKEVEANFSIYSSLFDANTNPNWVAKATPTTGPGLQVGGSGSTLKILPGNYLEACYDPFTQTSYVVNKPLLAAGGSPFKGYTWSTMGLPMGTTIRPLTGVFTSNGGSLDPNMPVQTVQLEVSDGTSTATATVTFSISIKSTAPEGGLPGEPCGMPVFQQWQGVPTYALEDAQANKPYGASLPVTGGTLPYSWYEDTSYSGRNDFDLSGLVIDQNSGIVRGTPFNSASGKTLMFKIIVKDSEGYIALGPGPIFTIFVK